MPFAQLAEKENIEKLCQDLNLAEEQFAAVQQWFAQILSTPILPNDDFTLAQINEKQCLKELAFYLNISSHFDVAGFNRALATHIICHQNRYSLMIFKAWCEAQWT